jgi:pilus assembly protein CpaB
MVSSDARFAVLVADRALASGTALGAEDLSVVQVNLPAEQAQLYASSAEEVEGSILRTALAAGEMVPVASFASSISPQRVVTIPIEPEHAAGGHLAPGDVVDVWATFVHGREPVTKLIVGSVEVVGLVKQGGLVGEEALSGISIAIPPEAAPRIVLALRAGDVDILASNGRASSGVRQSLTVQEL